jgi:crotonobetainyl-CoA:carnitine CoA-transferase CaiB-like acyl-CoA transferase
MLSEKDVEVQALEGVRILGCVSGIAGPAICKMLAWHGAEAITVETAAYS